jgi:LuxR family maltose regulon positive regulatory protein
MTDREMEVLQFLPTRLSTIEIAQYLNISPNTVKSHLRSIYKKLAVRSRNEAILRSTRYRLVAKNSEWVVKH